MNAPRLTAAVLYAADGYTTEGRDIKGRHAAGEGFLRGLLRHGELERLTLHCQTREQARQCERLYEHELAGRPVEWIPAARPQALKEPGTLYVPDPSLARQAWARRRSAAQRDWSLCGVTHTIATQAAVGMIQDLFEAPLQRWDALVCTSRAVQGAVSKLLEAQQEYLRGRLGAREFVLPQLPLIPLGVDSSLYAESPARRDEWRRSLDAGENATVVLFFGRLSYHAKAHHAPLYLSLERAARRSGRPVVLVLAGWFANDAIRKTFADDAARLCPSVRVVFVDGRKGDVRHSIWQAADVFCSLSDNIQETFGLTPIEAMAAGLPLVVSDWNGYRETVRDGVDGFRIPTRSPAPETGKDLGYRFAQGIDNYDSYCAYSCQFVEVDIGACELAFTRLIQDAALRRRMGAAGREQARRVYDWSVVVAQYQALWAELAELRAQSEESAPRGDSGAGDPAHLDPFAIYAGYPTQPLGPALRVRLATTDAEGGLAQLFSAESSAPGRFKELVPGQPELLALLRLVEAQPGLSVGELARRLPLSKQASALRALLWLAKHGLLELS